MAIRGQNLETIAPMLASFSISQTASVDDLKDTNIGEPVKLSGDSQVGPIGAGDQLIGRLVSLTLSDNDDGDRVATVQVGGICRLAISATVPVVGDRIVGGTAGTVKQAPSLSLDDPAGGNVARGTVLEVNGTTDCVILLN